MSLGQQLWEDDALVDFALVLKASTEVRVIWVHRLVLMTSSCYFRRLNEVCSAVVSVPCFESALQVLRYMYLKELPNMSESVYQSALALGCYQLVPHLKVPLEWSRNVLLNPPSSPRFISSLRVFEKSLQERVYYWKPFTK